MRRRDLLKTAAAMVAPMVIPRQVLAARGRPGANDRIRTGVIGCGARSAVLLNQSPGDIQIAALADCDLRQMGAESAFGRSASGLFPDDFARWPRYQDYRDMLGKPNGAEFADGKFEDIGGSDCIPDFGGFYHDSAKDKAGPNLGLRDLDGDGDLDLFQSCHIDLREPLLPYSPGEYRQGVFCWKNLFRETGETRFEKATGNGLAVEARLRYNREKQLYENASDARAPGLPYLFFADADNDGLQDALAVARAGGTMLFNLKDDIGEQNDQAEANPAKLQELQAAFADWEKDTQPAKWVRQDARNAEIGGTRKSGGTSTSSRRRGAAGARLAEAFTAADKNGDGKLSRDEYPQPGVFTDVDANCDGFATLEEVRTYFARRRSRAASTPSGGDQ